MALASGVSGGASTGRRASPSPVRFAGTPTPPSDVATDPPPRGRSSSNTSGPSDSGRTSHRTPSAGNLANATSRRNSCHLPLDDAFVQSKLAVGPWGGVTPCRVKPWGRARTPLQGAFNESNRPTAPFYPRSTRIATRVAPSPSLLHVPSPDPDLPSTLAAALLFTSTPRPILASVEGCVFASHPGRSQTDYFASTHYE